MLSCTCMILPVEWEITMVAGVRRPETTAREEATTVVIFLRLTIRFGRDEEGQSMQIGVDQDQKEAFWHNER